MRSPALVLLAVLVHGAACGPAGQPAKPAGTPATATGGAGATANFDDPGLAGACEATETEITADEPGAPTPQEAVEAFVDAHAILETATISDEQILFDGEVVGSVDVREAPAGGYYVASAQWCYPSPEGR